MKKDTLSGLFGFIFRHLRSCATLQTGIRLTACGLILVLLLPCFIFNPMTKTYAQTNFPVQEPAPVSAPPISFEVPSPESNVLSLFSTLSESTNSVSNYFTAPELPEGFENARTSSPFSRDISAFGSSFSSIFTTKVSASQPSGSVEFDFDGDDKADISRWRGTATDWQIKQSSNGNTTNLTFGNVSSIIAPGDFDGDGITDRAIFDAGTWTIKKSSNGTTQTISFGTSGDKPVTGDYDGDGKSDAAVFRASTNTWWILRSIDGNYTSTSFGASGDITAQGNYDGDNKTDIAIFRPSTGDWHISGSSSGYYSLHWGIASDIPTPADFDADGKTDAAVYRGSTGTWYVYKSSTNNGEYILQTWGNYGDQPVPADYDGDSKADFAVFRPTTGVWHIIKSSNSNYDYQTLGMAGDVAVSSAYLKKIGGTVFGYDMAKQRLLPKNSTGGTNLYSQNFSWGTGLVGLAGRAGMNAGFGISYNSLIWTKNPTSNSIVFDVDNANISPGFRFGFSTIEPIYYNSQRKKFSYLMVTPSGGRVEFNQIGASDTYETNDSGYAQLKTIGASDPNTPIENISIVISGTDGSTMNYEWKAGAFRCSQIKDRNGNFVSINHDEQGVLRTVTDTLGRIITVNYDTQLYPTSITQTWKNNNGQGTDITHTYATFAYTSLAINTNFTNLTVIGPANGTNLKVLQKVTFPTESNGAGPNTTFSYNSWGQVKQINNYAADNHLLNETKINLPADATNPQTDCPRFTETQIKTENFNLDSNNQPQAIVINNSITPNQTYNVGGHSGTATKIEVSMTGDPYGAVTRSYVGSSGWQEGLPIATEDLVMETILTQKRWTWTNYTQDDTSKSYILNPRVTQSKIGDTGSTKRTEIDYLMQSGNVSQYGLVSEVRLFDGTNNTLQKKSTTTYNLAADYISRRIIGLPSMVESWGLNQGTSALEYVSKATFNYDEGDFSDSTLEQNISTVIQHDNANYGNGFIIGRGNLTSQTRHDISGQTANVTSSTKYNITGAPVAQIDPLGRMIKISYADVFNDTPSNRNTFAYPTKLTDTAGNFSEVKYRYDIGANVWAKSPAPQGQSQGKITTRIYDDVGRIEKQKIENTGAYTRYEYPTNNIQSKVYTTINDVDGDGNIAEDEVYAESWTDGAGRIRYARTENPNSANGWGGSIVEYDILGRAIRSTVPTEINPVNPLNPMTWQPAGDDNRGVDGNGNPIWLWTQAEYDWKSRVTRQINSDGTDKLISYEGCGCAGGQVTTVQSELVPVPGQNYSARRTQKVYQDILGRSYKTEMLDWNSDVYKTLLNFYDGQDQIIVNREIAGTVSSNDYRESTFSFDGHGRLKTSQSPEQNTNTATTFTYTSDDKPQTITDGRGATKSYTYNPRGLIQQISWSVPQNSQIQVPSNVSFSYDALGNRTQMTDGFGSVSYEYNSLSQLTTETRQFNETVPLAPLPNNSFKTDYIYGLSGQLLSYKEPFGETVSYGYDKKGMLDSVSGYRATENLQMNYVTSAKYRAWGAVKEINYGNNRGVSMNYNNRLQAQQYTLNTGLQGNPTIYLQYNYYNDGKLKNSGIGYSDDFDRSYEYDFLGRLTSAKTGAEARGQTENNANNRPYRINLEYNKFGDIINQQKLNWTASFTSTFQYQNARMTSESTTKIIPNWVNETYGFTSVFDADGRKTSDGSDTKKFDAEGRLRYSSEIDTEINQDGDGKKIKTVEGVCQVESCPNLPVTKEYFIRSSVLGEIVSEIKDSTEEGLSRKTRIYGNGKEIAQRRLTYIGSQSIFTDATFLKSTDPSGVELTEILIHNSGNNYTYGGGKLDPFGAGVGNANPYPTGTPDPNYPDCDYGTDGDNYDDCEIPDFEDPENEEGEVGSVPQNTCYKDGIEIDCHEVMHALERNGSDVESSDEEEEDNAPSDEGQISTWGNDDDANPRASLEVEEREFEVAYTGMEATFKNDFYVTVKDNDTRRVSIWDLRVSTFSEVMESSLSLETPPEPSDDCLKALADANQDVDAYNRAWAAKAELEKAVDTYNSGNFTNLFSWSMLAAIGVRETGFQNIGERGGSGKNGKGVFQITTGNVSQDVLDSVSKSAEWVLDNKLAPEWNRLNKYGLDIGFLATLRNYNAGSAKTAEIIKQVQKAGGISGTRNDFDEGTAYPGLDTNKAPKDNSKGNYVSNVLGIARYCFGWQGVSREDY